MKGNRYQVFFLPDGAGPGEFNKENLIDGGVLPFDRKLEEGKVFIHEGINFAAHYVAIEVDHDPAPPEAIFRQIAKMEIPATLTKQRRNNERI